MEVNGSDRLPPQFSESTTHITLFPWLNESSKVNQTILGEVRDEPNNIYSFTIFTHNCSNLKPAKIKNMGERKDF